MPNKVSDPDKLRKFHDLVRAGHALVKLPEWKEFREQWIDREILTADKCIDNSGHMAEGELRHTCGWRGALKRVISKLDELSRTEI